MGLAESMPMWECGGRETHENGIQGCAEIVPRTAFSQAVVGGLGQDYLDLQRVCEGKDT